MRRWSRCWYQTELQEHGATACTDVTGFGIAGHLLEMARASERDVRLQLSSLPLLDGADKTVAAGLLSSLHPDNMRVGRAIANAEEAATNPVYPVIFDPQTAGGLLASVPAERSEACVADLQARGYVRACMVGVVDDRHETASQIWVEP